MAANDYKTKVTNQDPESVVKYINECLKDNKEWTPIESGNAIPFNHQTEECPN